MELNLDFNALMEQATTLVVQFGGKILVALLIFIVGKWVARRVTNLLGNLMEKQVDVTVARFISNLAYALALTVVIIAALSQLGVQTASFVAIVGAAGLAVGLALQGSLANFAAGVLLLIFRPIRVGDFVKVAGEAGTVQEISVFVTTLTTPDNVKIIVPNSGVMAGNITNFSAMPTRRIDLVFGVSYDADLALVKRELEAIVAAEERILADPPCQIAVAELADSSVNFVCRPWVNAADYWAVRFDLIERVKLRFDEVGVEIPFPQVQVHHPAREAA
jgi:small conductance mechanosensitive channel